MIDPFQTPPTASIPKSPGPHSVRRVVAGMSLSVTLALTALALVLRLWWHGESFGSLFHPERVWERSLLGAAIGVVVGAAAVVTVWTLPVFANFRFLVREGFEGIEPRVPDLLFVSAAAGWGEELFFRGILQPKIGLWATALAFVVGHGVMGVRSRGRAAFAVTLFGAGVGLGYLFRAQGLEAAMCAHACYDATILVILYMLMARRRAREVTT